MMQLLRIIIIFAIAGILCGCQTAPPTPHTETSGTIFVRNNCYSLLYDLLGDEKDVSLLRFIKREDSDVKKLLIAISDAARKGHAQLEIFAKQDRTLNLKLMDLPAGESSTRKDIALTERHQILHESGPPLELDLLLTQTDALRYGAHLARVGSRNDFNSDRAQYFLVLSQQLQSLHDQTVALLVSLREPIPPKK